MAPRPGKLLPWLLVPIAVVTYITVAGLTGFCPTCTLMVASVRDRLAPSRARTVSAVDSIIPAAITAVDLDGREVALSIGDGQPVIIDLWGTRCPPCIEQRRILAKLAAADGPLPRARIISIAVDRDIRDVQKFVADHPGTGQELIAGPDTIAAILAAAGAPLTPRASLELPTLIICDARGRMLPPRAGLQSLESLHADLRTAR